MAKYFRQQLGWKFLSNVRHRGPDGSLGIRWILETTGITQRRRRVFRRSGRSRQRRSVPGHLIPRYGTKPISFSSIPSTGLLGLLEPTNLTLHMTPCNSGPTLRALEWVGVQHRSSSPILEWALTSPCDNFSRTRWLTHALRGDTEDILGPNNVKDCFVFASWSILR